MLLNRHEDPDARGLQGMCASGSSRASLLPRITGECLRLGFVTLVLVGVDVFDVRFASLPPWQKADLESAFQDPAMVSQTSKKKIFWKVRNSAKDVDLNFCKVSKKRTQ